MSRIKDLLIAGFSLLLFLPAINLKAQTTELTLDRAIEIALQNNLEYNTSKLKVEQSKSLVPSAFEIDKSQLFFGRDQNNVAENGYPLNIIGVEQSFNFPTVYTAQYKANKKAASLSEKELESKRLQLIKDVSKAYYEIEYLTDKEYYYICMDTLYQDLTKEIANKYKNGATTNLELLNASAKHQQIHLSIDHIRYDRSIAYRKLIMLMNYNLPISVPQYKLSEIQLNETAIENNPGLQSKNLETQIQHDLLKVEKNRILPDINLSYYNGTNRYADSRNYRGYQIGISVPLFFSGQKSKIEAGKKAVSISRNEEEYYLSCLKFRREELMNELRKLKKSLGYFSTTGKKLSSEIVRTAHDSYESQEIDLYQYVQSIENAMTIELEYLDWLSKYNNVVLDLNYLTI